MIWQKYGVIQNVRHSGKRGGKTDKKSNKKLRRGRVHSQKTLRLCRWCSCWHWLILLYFLWVYLLMLLAFYETFRLHIFYFMRNLASLFFFCIFFLFYFTENLQVMMMKKLEFLSCPKTKRSWYGLRKKRKFSRFLSFWFCPIPKIENLEISEIWLFFQILTVVSLETTKIWMEQETEFLIQIKGKKILRFLSFQIWPISKIENLEISEILFTLNFETGCNSRFKKCQRNELRQKLKGSDII